MWNIFVVDDDPDVHTATEIALSRMVISGRRIKLHHAYSGQEARVFIDDNREICLVLLDAVMESTEAGVEFAKYVREDLGMSKKPTIVLRSGQVGLLTPAQVRTLPFIDDFIDKNQATVTALEALLNRYLPATEH